MTPSCKKPQSQSQVYTKETIVHPGQLLWQKQPLNFTENVMWFIIPTRSSIINSNDILSHLVIKFSTGNSRIFTLFVNVIFNSSCFLSSFVLLFWFLFIFCYISEMVLRHVNYIFQLKTKVGISFIMNLPIRFVSKYVYHSRFLSLVVIWRWNSIASIVLDSQDLFTSWLLHWCQGYPRIT